MTVKELKDRLEQFPEDVEVVIQKWNGLHTIAKAEYNEDYVYGTTFRHIILEADKV